MRRLIFLIFLAAMTGSSVAQSLLLSNEFGPLPNNTVIDLYGGNQYIEAKAFVTNTTDTDMNVMLRSTNVVHIPGSYNYFCWGQCYTDTTASEFPVLIPAGTTDSLNFMSHYICNGNAGTQVVRYTFFDMANPSDTVCLVVTYTAIPTACVDGPGAGTGHPSIYPNPARGFFTFCYDHENDAATSYSLIINKIHGGARHVFELDAANRRQLIDITALSPGMYFCTLFANGHALYTRKLIVQ